MIALWNQQARNQGLPRPGFVAPLLTRLAQDSPQAFTDITQGDQLPLRRVLLPDPTGFRSGHRLGIAGRQPRRISSPTLRS